MQSAAWPDAGVERPGDDLAGRGARVPDVDWRDPVLRHPTLPGARARAASGSGGRCAGFDAGFAAGGFKLSGEIPAPHVREGSLPTLMRSDCAAMASSRTSVSPNVVPGSTTERRTRAPTGTTAPAPTTLS